MIKNQAKKKIGKSGQIKRQCVICGKEILVKVFTDGKYTNGHYFGEIEQAEKYIPTGEIMSLGTTKAQIAKPTGKIKKWEYWECEKCYNEN